MHLVFSIPASLAMVRVIFFLVVGSPLVFVAQHAFAQNPCGFNAGAGRSDLTGPAAELGMMGYANPAQKTTGIHLRLSSRAFVIEDSCSSRRVVFVSADLGMITQAVKLAVIDRLKSRFGSMYTDSNVMLTATHTHSGPGGYSHFTLYNITTLGFDRANFEKIVSGISHSIESAHHRLQPVRLGLTQGELEGASVNRSLSAYRANPESGFSEGSTNKLMTLLKFEKLDGSLVGVVNWFAVHNTSMGKENKLISSDHKGFAAQRFEKETPGVVAAFANSDEGDVSPNVFGQNAQGFEEELFRASYIGELQYAKARALSSSDLEPLQGPLQYAHAWVRMPGFLVERRFSAAGPARLCRAAMGYSFAAGAEDGPSELPGFHEGMLQGQKLPLPIFLNLGVEFLRLFVGGDEQDERCHFPKPILVAPGDQNPAWSAEVLPFQVFRIGRLALIGVPGEVTTMAGRRLRKTVADALRGAGVDHVVIGGLANTYSGYVTTLEEYQLQQYEGASTQFGPNTLAAYQQIFARLSQEIARGAGQYAYGRRPGPVQTDRLVTFQTGVVYDDKRLWEKFGEVFDDASERYHRGQRVHVKFRSGHPKNSLNRPNFVYVQRWQGERWVTIARDGEFDVFYRWQRDKAIDCLACSFAHVEWRIPQSAASGWYRIVHQGDWKSGGDGKSRGYLGKTRQFWVE
ncbi:MAG: neutral/alkaline non-lysosomal ceramidase N-terminal domain-containing protein [Bdellovibrionota bacterium]